MAQMHPTININAPLKHDPSMLPRKHANHVLTMLDANCNKQAHCHHLPHPRRAAAAAAATPCPNPMTFFPTFVQAKGLKATR